MLSLSLNVTVYPNYFPQLCDIIIFFISTTSSSSSWIFLKTWSDKNFAQFSQIQTTSANHIKKYFRCVFMEANKRETWRSWLVTFHSFYVVVKTQLKWKWRAVKMSLKISFALLCFFHLKVDPNSVTFLSETWPLIKLCCHCRDSLHPITLMLP